ncbi:MAG: cadherin domain-containing protein [Bacteroidales bacterium]|nr:cadherin domain-containing protein [Bacteroidales bacterium]
MKTRPTHTTKDCISVKQTHNLELPETGVAVKKTPQKYSFTFLLVVAIQLILLNGNVSAAKYYISPTGNDNNTGTITSPFFNLNKAWTKVSAGDTIYARGGVYNYTVVQRIQNKSGTAANPIKVWAYPGERPVFNFGTAGFTGTTIAFATGWSSYLHVRGLRITNVPQVVDANIGFMLASSTNNCTIEYCEIDHIGGYGLTISSNCDNNLILNCDSHHNEDPLSSIPYDGSNGFGMTNNTTSDNNIFRNCRSWFNSDDGFDFFGSNTYVELDNCWSFLNGYSPVNMTHTGNGSGFKLGPNTNGVLTTHLRKLTNCLSFDNYLCGFDENFNSNGLNHFPSTLYNCTAFRNGDCGFYYQKFADIHILKNNLAYLNGTNYLINAASIQTNNSWNPGVTVSAADFISLDTAGMSGARQSNGNLPSLNFLHLASTSDLINAGVNVGLPFNGSAPDIGCFEYLITGNQYPVIAPQTFSIAENSVNGTLVGTVVASDPDAGQTLTYSIFSGNTNTAFAINASTGALTVANSAALNFETIPSFALIVKVQDNGSGSLSSQATITVNLTNQNEAPNIAPQTFSINENSANGATVGTVVASDPDAGQVLTYSILSGNTSGAFTINASTGVLYVANTTVLNFESIPSFALVIKVQDNGAGNLNNQATMTVNLVNVNEVPVIANQSFSINENSVNGTAVGTVVATDPDAGQTLTYTILSGNTSGAFAINASTGALTVANSTALNFESTPAFSLVVKAQDNGTGSLSSQATVTVTVLNVNEVPAISNQTFSINENSANGTSVGTVVATDPDAGQTLTYSILSGNTSGAFAINTSTGALTVASSVALNFESIPSFSLVIKVQDNGTGSLSSQATITVNLLNVNEAPVIANQAFSVAENSANGTGVGTVVASDPDAGQTLTFSILSGNTSGAFAINASTAAITVANSAVLNFESTPAFILVVKAQDNGTGTLSNQANITITLTDANDSPVINNQTFTLAENSINTTNVGTVVASDPDAGQVLAYSILSGNTLGAFTINGSTGALTVANSAALNFETTPSFSLIIKVQDNGAGSLSAQATITVNLTNVNEVPAIGNQTFSIAENAANGTNVGTVAASDPDAGQTLTYSILSGNTSGAFAINSTNGALTVANSTALNFESTPSFSLVVKVQDNGSGTLSNQATVTVNLTDTNDSPVIINQSFSIAENSANGTSVGVVIASDPDAGQTLTYSILSGNTSGAFAINSASGSLTVANSPALDFESTPSFALVVKVQDNGTGTLSSQATVTVNLTNGNDAPVIANQTFSIAENSANGTNVGTVIATDPDAGQTLTYSILSGNTDDAFTINSTSGLLTVANVTALNFETTPTFALVVKVQDNGTGSLSAQATITVNLTNVNEVPSIGNQTFSIAENSANGTNVGTVAASDPDAGQTLAYSILSGNTSGAFAISTTTGALTVANSTALNYETTPIFSLIVNVQDNGTVSLSSQATITVNLTNGNDAPVIANQTFSIAENSANGTNVGTVVAADPDAGQTLTYSILSGNTAGAFTINSTSGILTVANGTALNFETTPSFALVVIVQDNGTGSLSAQATITVNLTNVNEVPAIGNQTFSIAENSANGTNVGTVAASDPDAGQTLAYSILSGNTSGAFAISTTTGALTVANSTALNYETTPIFSLIVNVQDNGTVSLSSQATVTVNLTNGNDTPVIANQTFSIAENSANGTNVGTVVATDPDAGQTLTYSILSGNTAGAFTINSTSGILTVANGTALNFETTPSFALVVKVQDNGTGSLSAQATITVNLTNVNEVPSIGNQTFSIAENSANGTNVGTVAASDPDAGQTLAYSILSGNTSGAFAISTTTGALTVANSPALNFESNPSFSLVVKVQDNGSGTLSAQATITVNLSNINEVPVINNQAFSIIENSANGTNVGTVLASDPDAGQTLSYSILSGNTSSAFNINSITGVITVANSSALNFETTPSYSLVIKVQDNGAGLLNSQAVITINLTDANDLPVISNQAFSIAENSSNGSIVGNIIATDPDAGQSLTFSILSGNTSSAFSINTSTGQLTVANSSVLNFEAIPSFSLLVKVQDNGTVSLSSQAIITVNLSNVNESPLISNQSFTISESAANTSNVGTVVATDPDAGQLLTYAILSGNASGAFAINISTGQVTVANSSVLDFESTPVYSLIVKVEDNGTVALSNQATITISLTDANEAPFIANQSFSISENSANGTIIGTVSASDPDAGQTLTYTILSGNTAGAFTINAASGELSVANTTALNFEQVPVYSVVVKVQDNGTVSLSNQAAITIQVLDINETPLISNQSFTLSENASNGYPVGTVLATDPDAGQSLMYSILSGNTDGAFSINALSGTILVADSSVLSFENTSSYSLIIRVDDNGTVSLNNQATITISMTDANEAPEISNQSFTLSENSANGTTIGTIIANDPDAGQTLSYFILSGNTSGAFTLNPVTGQLTVLNSAVLNFEATSSFSLLIEVEDNGSVSLSSQATITISLTDVNESPNISNQSFSIAENSMNGTSVGVVAASDPDAGQTLAYSILSGNTSGAFAVNTTTGAITVANSAAMNYEINPVFNLSIQVHDNGIGSLSSQAVITINLVNANEAPVISNQSFSIAENSTNGTTVGTVSATDPDAGQTLTYSIQSGNSSSAFALNTTSGLLTVSNSAALDFETTPVYLLIVKVQDNGTGSLSSNATVTVTLQNVNDQPQVNDQVFAVAENAANGTNVGIVTATDPDAGQQLSYSILSGNTDGAFTINTTTGALTVANTSALDFEINPAFILSVNVQDNGTGTLSDQADITINIVNGNEPRSSNHRHSQHWNTR